MTAPVTPAPEPAPARKVNLLSELALAGTGAVAAGMSTLTASLTVATASDRKALVASAIAAGLTAVTFFGNSLRNWLNEQ